MEYVDPEAEKDEEFALALGRQFEGNQGALSGPKERGEATRIEALRRLHERQRAGQEQVAAYRPVHTLLLPGTRESAIPVVWGVAYMEGDSLVVIRLLDKGMPEDTLAILCRQALAVYYPGDMMALSEQYLGGRVGNWRMLPDTLDRAEEVALSSYDPRAHEGLPPRVEAALRKVLAGPVTELDTTDFSSQRRPWAEEPQALHPTFDPEDEGWAAYAPTPADSWRADLALSQANGALVTLPETAATPNLTHAGILEFMRVGTYTPASAHYSAYLDNVAVRRDALNVETVANQMKSHERMLKAGSTQAPGCAGEIVVGSRVRYRINYDRDPPGSFEERIRADLHNKSMEPDGSETWTHRTFVVKTVVEPTESPPSARTYTLGGVPRAFYRAELCPVHNIELDAYVRIRLSANVYYRKQIEQKIKTAERHTRYNHKFSRSIFKVAGELRKDAGDDVRRYVLEVAWAAADVYPLAAWETDPRENLWSAAHVYTKQGDGAFHGYLTSDLLRVDQQTALKMETGLGRAAYTECLRKIQRRYPSGIGATVVESAPTYDGADEGVLAAVEKLKERVVKWLSDNNTVAEMHGVFVIERNIQGEDLWHGIRSLLATGSELDKWNANAHTLVAGKRKRTDISRIPAVRWGTLSEPFGREQYGRWLRRNGQRQTVKEIGMIIERTATISASPDGWVYEEALVPSEPRRLVGAIEIKSPSGSYFRKNQVDWSDPDMWKGVVATGVDEAYFDPEKLRKSKKGYYYQCLANLFLVPDLNWIDFVVYLPENGLPGNVAPNNAGPGFENMYIHRFNKTDALRAEWEALESRVRSAYAANLKGIEGLYRAFVETYVDVT
jgi:hypothetical protein